MDHSLLPESNCAGVYVADMLAFDNDVVDVDDVADDFAVETND